MKKVIFADADNNEYINVPVLDLRDFVIPQKGDLIRWMNMSFRVEGLIHNYDKQELLVSIVKL